MKPTHRETAAWLKRRVATLKAESGMSWHQIAERMSSSDVRITPGSLMSKHSRVSFTATELIVLLRALGVPTLDLTATRPPAVRALQSSPAEIPSSTHP